MTLFADDEYMLRFVPKTFTDRHKGDCIYLFVSKRGSVHREYSSRSKVFKVLKPILDLLPPMDKAYVAADYKAHTVDWVLPKDEFEAITGERP